MGVTAPDKDNNDSASSDADPKSELILNRQIHPIRLYYWQFFGINVGD